MTLFRILLALLFATTALAQSADLHITAQGTPRTDQYDILFAMLNRGPDVAKKAVLTIDIPAGLTIRRFSYGAGDQANKPCDLNARPVRCETGDLHAGAPFHYGGLELGVPLADANYVVTFTMTSETPDPDTSTNSSSVTFATRIEADLNFVMNRLVDRVDPGGQGDFTAVLCNDVRDNQRPTVRVEFTPTNGVITQLEPAGAFTCAIEDQGRKGVCTIAELPQGCSGTFRIRVRTNNDRIGGQATLQAVAIGDVRERNPANNEVTQILPIYRWIAVKNPNDAGPGSLREAINEANANCTPGPCRIVFEIPGPVPAEGWFTITPATPLPSITAERVTLEGNRQTAFTGNTNGAGPEIAIDGRNARRGIRMLATCEGVVDGLAIGNFDEDQGLWISTGANCGGRADKRAVLENHIGVDPSGQVPWPNRRGLRADFAGPLTVSRNVISNNRFSGVWLWRGSATITTNLFQDNGASAVFLGPEVTTATVNDNVIRRSAHMGVAVARQVGSAQIRRNLMRDNGGLAIDWGLDGVSPNDIDDKHAPTNAPVLLSAKYDPASNRTTVVARVSSKPLGDFNAGTLDVYRNDVPDGDGEQHIGSNTNFTSREEPFTLTVIVPGNYRRKWINATWTREQQDFGPAAQSHFSPNASITSELSNSVLVE